MVRYYIICEGRVQGVGFRFFCQMNATELDLTGYAHNLNNGMVEIEVQGSEEKINMFAYTATQMMRALHGYLNVELICQKKIDLKPSEKKFVIR